MVRLGRVRGERSRLKRPGTTGSACDQRLHPRPKFGGSGVFDMKIALISTYTHPIALGMGYVSSYLKGASADRRRYKPCGPQVHRPFLASASVLRAERAVTLPGD